MREIGRGGEGVVCEAVDRVTGERAAVKVLRRSPGRDAGRIRREAAILRWLRLPGVIEILDDGVDDGVIWIATQLLDASPFPGESTRRNWESIETVVLGLLEAVGRVHSAGIVHGDLKPSNVLVDSRGVVTLVDLGLGAARADRFTQATALGGGTPGYVAPECLDGAAPDVRSDLFAIGVMLRDALASPSAATRTARDSARAPARVRRVVSRLLADDPEARPPSAAEAIDGLRTGAKCARRRLWTRRELRSRFRGPDLFLHLREDAARELYRRTRGDPEAVEYELKSWLRSGLARMEGGLVVVDRPALDRIVTPHAGRRANSGADAHATFARALHAGRSRDVVRLARRVASIEFESGRAARALTALEEGAAAARSARDVHALRDVARRAVGAALNSGFGRDIDRALWLVQRGDEGDEELRALADVAKAAAELQRGQTWAAWLLASRVTRHGPRPVLRLAWSVREKAARNLGPSHRAEVVAQSAAWMRSERTSEARTAYRTWRAWTLYLEGRCVEALRLHLLGLASERSPSLRIRMMLDAAVAAMDAGRASLAVDLARRAKSAARSLRRPIQEARAWLALREARSRRGDVLTPDLEPLAAAESLGTRALTEQFGLVEAVIAWRSGAFATSRRIIGPIAARIDVRHASPLQLALVALHAAAGATITSERGLALARRANRTVAPGLALQILALVSKALPSHRRTLASMGRGLTLPRVESEWSRPRETLSLAAAAAMLGIDRQE